VLNKFISIFCIFVPLVFNYLYGDLVANAGENGRRFQDKIDKETAKLLGIACESDKTLQKNDFQGSHTEKSFVALQRSESEDSLCALSLLDSLALLTYEIETPALSDSIEILEKSQQSSCDKFEESVCYDSLDSSYNALLTYIPENSWRTPDMEGRELTIEIAEKYPPGNFVYRSVENNSWGIGEELIFAIYYGFYRAGTAKMSVIEKKDVNGGICYHIQTTAQSNNFISKFYKVNDRVNSYIDIEGIFSRRLEKRLREGRYKSDRIVDFYHDRLIALNTKKKYLFAEIPLYVQDILSSLYYIRTIDLKVGKTEKINAYADGKVYLLDVVVHKKETIEVPAGKFKCLKVEPVLKSEGIFRQKGKLTIWITDDSRKMPVKMKSKVVIGSISSNLESYNLGNIK